MKNVLVFTFLIILSFQVKAQTADDLELIDSDDYKLLEKFDDSDSDNELTGVGEESNVVGDDDLTALDDLEALKEDIGEIKYDDPEKEKEENKPRISTKNTTEQFMFDIGKEEKELLHISKLVKSRINNNEWDELSKMSTSGSYTVLEGDWLWKIAKNLFGSGFYYPKIWSLNPYITNPHIIEPGMVLLFDTGDAESMPSIRLGSFSAVEQDENSKFNKLGNLNNFEKWGFNTKPKWIEEKKKLVSQGLYVQYASEATMTDLKRISDANLITEYEKYEPPKINDLSDSGIEESYDAFGFDKNAKISFNFKEGFYLNTFLSTNVVQDFGKVDSSYNDGLYFSSHSQVYVRFDSDMNVIPGDKFSIYTAEGKQSHANSDRSGYKYTVVGQIQVVNKIKDVWLCDIYDSNDLIARGDRITVYTPKIEKITKTFNNRNIEAAIISSHSPMQTTLSFGDVVYLDRGRADGVEMGNVFEVYGFQDRATQKNITDIPTYKNGELTIITLTDNFATALVTRSVRDFFVGDIAITKSKSAALSSSKKRKRKLKAEGKMLENDALDELDVELNLDDLNDSILNKADEIQFTEDELAELERQEREKSVIKEGERDIRALERLEKEIETAEQMLNEARLDEDKLLEEENLNKIEKESGFSQEESLEDIEENFGKKYMDDDLKGKDNPYGLNEFDIEEIDELLNLDQNSKL
jgi:hypothetical protein